MCAQVKTEDELKIEARKQRLAEWKAKQSSSSAGRKKTASFLSVGGGGKKQVAAKVAESTGDGEGNKSGVDDMEASLMEALQEAQRLETQQQSPPPGVVAPIDAPRNPWSVTDGGVGGRPGQRPPAAAPAVSAAAPAEEEEEMDLDDLMAKYSNDAVNARQDAMRKAAEVAAQV